MKQPVELKTALLVIFAVLLVAGGLLIYGINPPGTKETSSPNSSRAIEEATSSTPQDNSTSSIAAAVRIATTSTDLIFPVYPFVGPDLVTGQGYATFRDGTSTYSFDSATAGGPPPPWNFRGPTGAPPYGVITQLSFNGGIMSDAFSADHQYVAFEAGNRLSSSSVQFSLITVKLNGGDTKFIPFPATSTDPNAIPYVENYSWGSDDSLNLVFYFIYGSGNDDYYRRTIPELWNYNLTSQKFIDLGSTQSQQDILSSGCGDEASLTQQSDTTGISENLRVHQLSPVKLIGISAGNAAYNRNIDQETLCDGIKIEQQNGQYSVYRNGNLVGQQREFWGMFLEPVSAFQYNNKHYFILGGGDCGNQYCYYDYDLFSVDSSGKWTPINGQTTENNKIFSTTNLWSTENPVGESVYAENGNLYIITGDGDYLEAVVVNASDTYVMTVSGGATSTNPQNSVPADIQKLLLASQG